MTDTKPRHQIWLFLLLLLTVLNLVDFVQVQFRSILKKSHDSYKQLSV